MMFFLLLMLLAGGNSQDCSSSLYISPTGSSWLIENPRHPARYGPSTNCSWHLHTDQDKRLTLDCPITELENKATWKCFDKLWVVGSSLYDNEDFCEPFNAQSTSNNMTLKFTSRSQSKGGRFICTVRAINKEECDCGWYPTRNQRKIVGGTEVKVNEFPMMVSIIDKRRLSHVCGGVIISKNFVLTAAHCLQGLDVKLTSLFVGENNISKVSDTDATRLLCAAEFFVHPNYTNFIMNDIALIKTATPIDFNNMVGPVCLPFNRPFLPAINENLTVIGWGITSYGGPASDVLLKTNIKVVPEARCKAVYKNSVSTGQHVCTYERGHDSCQADSGGPLIVIEKRTTSCFLAALVSFGPNNCGGSDPSINTKITPYLDWIREQTGDEFCIK